MDSISIDDIVTSVGRIKGRVLKTPLVESIHLKIAYEKNKELMSHNGASFYLKLESEQITGSFKARGAMNVILRLLESPNSLEKDITADSPIGASNNVSICTASTGNHALGVANALLTVEKMLGSNSKIPAKIFVPSNISSAKLDLLNAMNAPLEIVETNDCLVSELAAIEFAKKTGATFISPYNDLQIIAGTATIGYEVVNDLDDERPLIVFVPVGGGGMISGIAAAVKKFRPNSMVIGTIPFENDAMYRAVEVGHVTSDFRNGETWSDGTAGGIEENSVTFNFCKDAILDIDEILKRINKKTFDSTIGVDAIVRVSETAIEEAMMFVLNTHHKVIEGSAGTSIAAIRSLFELSPNIFDGYDVVSVLCGSNLPLKKLRTLLDKYPEQ